MLSEEVLHPHPSICGRKAAAPTWLLPLVRAPWNWIQMETNLHLNLSMLRTWTTWHCCISQGFIWETGDQKGPQWPQIGPRVMCAPDNLVPFENWWKVCWFCLFWEKPKKCPRVEKKQQIGHLYLILVPVWLYDGNPVSLSCWLVQSEQLKVNNIGCVHQAQAPWG